MHENNKESEIWNGQFQYLKNIDVGTEATECWNHGVNCDFNCHQRFKKEIIS